MTARSASVSHSGTISIAGSSPRGPRRGHGRRVRCAPTNRSRPWGIIRNGTDLVVVLDRRSVGIFWETGRLVERGLDRAFLDLCIVHAAQAAQIVEPVLRRWRALRRARLDVVDMGCRAATAGDRAA